MLLSERREFITTNWKLEREFEYLMQNPVGFSLNLQLQFTNRQSYNLSQMGVIANYQPIAHFWPYLLNFNV